ncbi:MAG: hypothetical protein IMF11_05070 [Proteobacteria bacterium]|nr:hypothetical protein [Pseudomonadota bacterium]
MDNKIECPFVCLFGDVTDCPYIEDFTYCHDIVTAPGNGDAWCSRMIEKGLNEKEISPQGPLMRQNYSCILCGLKSFVVYHPKEGAFDITIKIREDHKKREPTCPCPVDDLYIAGKPTEA